MEKGDKIIFKRTITQEATEDTPPFVYAEQGEEGTFIKQSDLPRHRFDCLVENKRGEQFYVMNDEIETVNSQPPRL